MMNKGHENDAILKEILVTVYKCFFAESRQATTHQRDIILHAVEFFQRGSLTRPITSYYQNVLG